MQCLQLPPFVIILVYSPTKYSKWILPSKATKGEASNWTHPTQAPALCKCILCSCKSFNAITERSRCLCNFPFSYFPSPPATLCRQFSRNRKTLQALGYFRVTFDCAVMGWEIKVRQVWWRTKALWSAMQHNKWEIVQRSLGRAPAFISGRAPLI